MSTNFYNKYLLVNKDDNPGKSIDSSILKKDFTLNYSDYEKLKMAEQYNKLYSNTYEQNKTDVTINENKKIFNLSLAQLVKNSGPVYINLINDLSVYFSIEEKDKSINKLGLILTKDQNLLYIGMLILIISFFLWLIQITS
jgi:hypothetical protein